MADLPNEITMIILSNLPVISLLRFNCVSKQWRSWISCPKFHLSNQRPEGAVAMLDSSFRFISQRLTLEEINDPFMERMDETSSCLFLGSCHGLILFNVNEHIYLWNPSTRFRAKVLELYFMLGDYYIHGGLCFDTSKNVYKAVLIGSEFVIVASLEDKQWRLLEFPYDILSVCDGITLHGRIHYRVRVNQSYISYNEHLTNALVYFDPTSEKFHTFPVPEPKSDQEENVIAGLGGLGVLNECLCMTHLHDDKSVEILVMKEYGVKESWTSLFFISNSELDPYLGTIEPLFMTENGEFVLVTWNSEKVVVYNPKNNNILNVVVDGKTEYIWGTIRYVESLISPKEYVLL